MRRNWLAKTNQSTAKPAPNFLDQRGQSAEAIKAFDWKSSQLGEPVHWPQSLKTAVGLVLGSDQPCNLVWGRDLITFYNDAYRPLMGSNIPEGIGVPFPAFRPDVWPSVEKQIMAAFAGRGSTVENIQVLTRRNGDAKEAYFTLSCSPIPDETGRVGGVINCMLETTRTIHAQRELEGENSLLKRGLNLLPQMVWSTLADGYPDFYNDRWYEFTGKSRGLADGENWADVLHPNDREGTWLLWRHSLHTGEPYEAQYRLKHHEGGHRWTLGQALPERDEAGKIIRWYGTCTDIHEQVLAKEHLQSLQSQLVHVSKVSAMGNLAAVLAHEVNQPLAAAANYAAGLRRQLSTGASPEALLEGMEGVEKAVLKAGDIVRRLRTMAPVQAPQRVEVHVSSLVNEAQQFLREECSDIKVELDVEDGAIVVCDPFQIHQVFTNLIRNACEAMKGDAKPRISIITNSDGARLRVNIEDNGPGLRPGNEEAIFDAFKPSDKSGGMGFGLSICRTIVEAHGGVIKAENLAPRGARFHFDLPTGMLAH